MALYLTLLELKVFVSPSYVFSLLAGRSEFEHRARTCAFLGHKPHMKGAMIYDITKKQVLVSIHNVHHEKKKINFTMLSS